MIFNPRPIIRSNIRINYFMHTRPNGNYKKFCRFKRQNVAKLFDCKLVDLRIVILRDALKKKGFAYLVSANLIVSAL